MYGIFFKNNAGYLRAQNLSAIKSIVEISMVFKSSSIFYAIIVFWIVSCGVAVLDDFDLDETEKDAFSTDYQMRDLPVTALYEGPFALGELENDQINEASGVAVSRLNPGHVWTHNDSGDFNRIFLVGPQGQNAGTFRVDESGNRDWEDMAIGPGPDPNLDYLYIADIGDNRAQYSFVRIFRLPEPRASDYDTALPLVPVDGAEMMQLTYPDGPKDAETLMIDPLTKDIYIVSKREFPVTVYVARYPQSVDDATELTRLGTLPFTDATAGDISPDGLRILIKTKTEVFMWSRDSTETIAQAFERQPVRLPYVPEPQGEAIAWNTDGTGYYVLSEARSVTPILYYYAEMDPSE